MSQQRARALTAGSGVPVLSPHTRLSLTLAMAGAKDNIVAALNGPAAGDAVAEGAGDSEEWRMPEPECDDDVNSPAVVRSSRDQSLAELLVSVSSSTAVAATQ